MRVILVGPPVAVGADVYGGGVGGYARNLQVYLGQSESARVEFIPCYTTLRREDCYRLTLAWILVKDLWSLLRMISKGNIVHLLAQYQHALPRDVGMVAIAWLFRRPCVCDIRSGAFARWYQHSSRFRRFLVRWMLQKCDLVLCEGKSCADYVKHRIGFDAHYFPNVVPASEAPTTIPDRFGRESIRVLFVGNCCHGKGAMDLVNAFKLARQVHIPVELTLIGAESRGFKSSLDRMASEHPELPIKRCGVLEHREVLASMARSDVYCLPTIHSREGHTNSVNEAMMMGMAIICTRHGFLPEVLDHEIAYFVDKKDPVAIADAIRRIWEDPDEAKARAAKGHAFLMKRFLAEPLFQWLGDRYREIAVGETTNGGGQRAEDGEPQSGYGRTVGRSDGQTVGQLDGGQRTDDRNQKSSDECRGIEAAMDGQTVVSSKPVKSKNTEAARKDSNR